MSIRIRIDRAGRVVIPKALREACGIDEDTPIEVQRIGRELRLIPVDTVPRRTIVENGWVVFDTGRPHETDIDDVIDELHERRSGDLAAG